MKVAEASKFPFERFDSNQIEAHDPRQDAVVEGDASTLPDSAAGVALSQQAVMVTAFAPTDDGPGTLLRLSELAGESCPCEVHLPRGLTVATAQPVNLRGQPQGHIIPIQNGTFRFDCAAFAPASFLLQP